jgi:hypothetical protein
MQATARMASVVSSALPARRRLIRVVRQENMPMNPNSLFGFDYIVNPESGELHKASGGQLSGAHNLAVADLENFIGLANLDSIPIHWNFDGTPIPVYDLVTGDFVGEYPLNKCKHCFPHLA